MPAANDRHPSLAENGADAHANAASGPRPERRNRRASCLADALRLQLEACCDDEGLAAIVVSDELGFCVAHAGGDGEHEELAARLPMLADPERRLRRADTGAALAAPTALALKTFSVAGTTLHACAVAGAPSHADAASAPARRRAQPHPPALERVANGFSRMLDG